ncbi:anthranilate synthase family protein [Rhodococcus erythropolis]|uniref:anthranilate synthase family protein n=1 Tax=Rhodococcus erythropolis TaxID=1833 RepID=UPI003013A9EF
MSPPLSTDLLTEILAGNCSVYALLCRADPATGARTVTALSGQLRQHELIEEISTTADVFVLLPYRQIRERGYPAHDDGAPLLAIYIDEQQDYPLTSVLDKLPRRSFALTDGHFDSSDADYERKVAAIVSEEIGNGRGANFVIKREFSAECTPYNSTVPLSAFGELLDNERGAYWTFLVHTEGLVLVGASPEQHVVLDNGTAVMNPISGTYRYPPGGPTLDGVQQFLDDRKETDELYMVVDEELKMMCRICEPGTTRVHGPALKEMAWVAHTEYFIEGQTRRDPREILRETMFAPTVTGSPVESATEVIARYETTGRGYYSGVAALITRSGGGAPTLDSAILIRTAAIEPDCGRVRVAVGATLVRHSDPGAEVYETHAKAQSVLAAFGHSKPHASWNRHPMITTALAHRNDQIAGFWSPNYPHDVRSRVLDGRKALVVDAEDTFTAMLDHQLRSLGLTVTVRRFDDMYTTSDHDLVIVGPGPGDPTDVDDEKIVHLRAQIDDLLSTQRPFLAICLSHQILASRLGLPLTRRAEPNQGKQARVDVFGQSENVGFYNTFEARSAPGRIDVAGIGPVTVSADTATGAIHALEGPHFASVQFHPESILTVNGPRILAHMSERLLST